jgi:hypothetical protein
MSAMGRSLLRTRFAALAIAMLFIVAQGCGPEAAVGPSLIEESDNRLKEELAKSSNLVQGEDGPKLLSPKERRTARFADRRAKLKYTKREGLHIDLPYLSGRKLDEIEQFDIGDQLGEVRSREDLPGGEELITFDNASIWLWEGRIYRIRKELAHPMDMATALGTSGFPTSLGKAVDASVEVRWNNQWAQRRIRMERNSGDRQLFDVIEVYKLLPSEQR